MCTKVHTHWTPVAGIKESLMQKIHFVHILHHDFLRRFVDSDRAIEAIFNDEFGSRMKKTVKAMMEMTSMVIWDNQLLVKPKL